ncbi:MAG: beta-lactamase family protein [Planctomycetaceae bacterium]|nr:beta-lactamase family protein [Planctomycetaceae bacterium]
MSTVRFVLFALLIGAIATPDSVMAYQAVPTAKPEDAGLSSEGLAKIPARMQQFVDAHQTAGVVSLVAAKGRVVHLSAVGNADLDGQRAMTTDTVFAIASMTKPITAASVMILQDEGKLKLDDPVSKYIPVFASIKLKGGAAPSRPVTVRDCLRHTNGLVSDQRNTGTLQETAEALGRSELAFEPGSKWQYGPGLSVAGRVVEVVSGKPFDVFLAERIFKPLAMNETTFHPNDAQLKRLAKLYQPGKDGKGLQPGSHWLFDVNDATTPNPSGGLYSTATDLVQFYQMVLNDGELNGQRILSASAVKEMTSLQTEKLETGFTSGNGWGLGFCLIQEPQGATAALSKGSFGHGGAFGTQGWIDPSRRMIFVLLIARANFGNGDASELRSELQRLAVEAAR